MNDPWKSRLNEKRVSYKSTPQFECYRSLAKSLAIPEQICSSQNVNRSRLICRNKSPSFWNSLEELRPSRALHYLWSGKWRERGREREREREKEGQRERTSLNLSAKRVGWAIEKRQWIPKDFFFFLWWWQERETFQGLKKKKKKLMMEHQRARSPIAFIFAREKKTFFGKEKKSFVSSNVYMGVRKVARLTL